MLILLVSVAHAVSPWIDVDADVIATAVVQSPPEAVVETLSDLARLSTLFDDSCTTRWAWGARTAGVDGRGRVTWRPGLLNRRLTVVVSRVDEDLVELDHLGNRGFITRFEVEQDPAGTAVTAHTYIQGPPWPFRELYHLQIKPAWEQCFVDALGRIDAATGHAPGGVTGN